MAAGIVGRIAGLDGMTGGVYTGRLAVSANTVFAGFTTLARLIFRSCFLPPRSWLAAAGVAAIVHECFFLEVKYNTKMTMKATTASDAIVTAAMQPPDHLPACALGASGIILILRADIDFSLQTFTCKQYKKNKSETNKKKLKS